MNGTHPDISQKREVAEPASGQLICVRKIGRQLPPRRAHRWLTIGTLRPILCTGSYTWRLGRVASKAESVIIGFGINYPARQYCGRKHGSLIGTLKPATNQGPRVHYLY